MVTTVNNYLHLGWVRNIPASLQKTWMLVREFFVKDISTYPTIIRNCCRRRCSALDHYDYTSNKVTLLLHRQAFCFFPLADKLEEAGVKNIFTVEPEQAEEPVPLKEIDEKISEIAGNFFARGHETVDVRLVGHSLGALVAAKRIWRREDNPKIHFSKCISLGGRLKYVDNDFRWFCRGVRAEIDKTFEAYEKKPNKTELHTIWGDRDGCVPEESAHLNKNRLTVEGYGHGGVVFSKRAQKKIVELLRS